MRNLIGRLILASVLIGIGINGFFVPHHFLDGGMIGVGLVFHYWLDVQPGLIMILFSIPLYFIAFLKDKPLFFNSIHGLWLTSFFIDLLKPTQFIIHTSPLISVIGGGITVGIGIGLLLQANSSSGGIDLVAALISKATGVNTGLLIFMFDLVILSFGVVVVGSHTFIPSIVAITIIALFTSLFTWNFDKP
ncbi:YitT family protein [Bacillus sp. 2205SS5-2]|uniref:YitT family protein n=1 Tax=Bacillus sp. 2205SS5-2 TaxID=3109031 RepID=UPI003004BE89